jgi:PII-like signaling protein
MPEPLQKQPGLSVAFVRDRVYVSGGRSTHLHNANILRLSLDLPIIVEIVEETFKIVASLPELETMMPVGLITMERAQVFRYGR